MDLPKNSNPDRRHLNRDLLAQSNPDLPSSYQDRVKRILARHGIEPHAGAVIAVEMVLGMSRGADTRVPLGPWQDRSVEFMESVAGGAANITALDMHADETTVHLHGLWVPICHVVRKQRGPHPKQGFRKQKEVSVLSFSAVAGRTTDDVRKTTIGWHDKYAEYMKPVGLQRGVSGGRSEHIPQQELYEMTDEIEAPGKEIVAIMQDPRGHFASLRRPTPEELADNDKWFAYLAFVFSVLFAAIKKNWDHLLILGKAGIFTIRTKAKWQDLAHERDQWKARSEASEKELKGTKDAHASECVALKKRLAETEAKPILAREITAILGLPHVSRPGRDGRPQDMVVDSTGQMLVMKGLFFLKPDGKKLSVPRFIQSALQLSSNGEVFPTLAALVGSPRALATMCAMLQDFAAETPLKRVDHAMPTAETRQMVLVANLETYHRISKQTTRQLLQEGTLTVDCHNRGVLLPSGIGLGYVFNVDKSKCKVINDPTDRAPAQIGNPEAWTTYITDDPIDALRVRDGSQGLVSSQLVETNSVTETRLNTLKIGHREWMASASVFSSGWDPALSVRLRTCAEFMNGLRDYARRTTGEPHTPNSAKTQDFGGLA